MPIFLHVHIYAAYDPKAMFCGTRSFSQVDGGESPTTSPSKLKQSFSMSKKKKSSNKKNPYSSAGIDKFEKILAELDANKERIMLRAKSQGDATVRFTYKPDSEDWIPIIIKKREQKEERAKAATKRLPAPPSTRVAKRELEEIKKDGEEGVRKCEEVREVGEVRRRRRRYSWGDCYWPLVIVLVLVLLVFGRSFAICWTTMCWYLVPMMKSVGKSLRRRELGKSLGDKRLGPKAHIVSSR